jgi:hypothetical protein
MAWQQLLSIIAEAKELDRLNLTKVPVECPNDYTTLQQGPGGTLFCPYDGWKYPGDA